MSNQYVRKISDYYIKDEEARQNIQDLQTTVDSLNETVELQKNKINEQTNVINNHSNVISSLTSDVEGLKTTNGVNVNYNSTTETITFGVG